MAALLLLRDLRTELARWEAGLVETARASGATWADLAQPMGIADCQAAENHYLRLRPTPSTLQATATGAERIKAVRNHRAAKRTVTTWAQTNAADAPDPIPPPRTTPPIDGRHRVRSKVEGGPSRRRAGAIEGSQVTLDDVLTRRGDRQTGACRPA